MVRKIYWFSIICLIVLISVFIMMFLKNDQFGQYNFPRCFTVEKKQITIQCVDGRLGNQMFMFAVLYGLSELNDRQATIQYCHYKYLVDTFDISIPIVADLPEEEQKSYEIARFRRLPQDGNISSEVNMVKGDKWPYSYTFFNEQRNELRRIFRFKRKYVIAAQKYLTYIKTTRSKNVTFISVHVRRTDYIAHMRFAVHQRPVTMNFFENAFDYFRLKYKNVVFMVISDDLEWCRDNFNWTDTFVQANMPLEVGYDLALMAACNHSIFDYGTFGFWGAFLTKGETVYFANNTMPGYNPFLEDQHFFLPDWRGM